MKLIRLKFISSHCSSSFNILLLPFSCSSTTASSSLRTLNTNKNTKMKMKTFNNYCAFYVLVLKSIEKYLMLSNLSTLLWDLFVTVCESANGNFGRKTCMQSLGLSIYILFCAECCLLHYSFIKLMNALRFSSR